MCQTSDLAVMVVDQNDEDLKRTCESLNKLGISKIVCVNSYTDAIDTIRDDGGIDIVIADFHIEPNKALGLLLCGAMKKKDPSIYFILISKEFSCSIVLDSLPIADDIIHKDKEGEIEELMQKWLNLAAYRNTVKEILNGKPKVS